MQSTRDPLTGFLVEPVLREALSHELSGTRRYGSPCVVVVEIVGFQQWADSRGALRADLVLRGVSAMLRSSSRRSDVLGVLGPGRLCVVLPRTDLARGQVVAKRVRRHCARLSCGDLVLAVGLVHDPSATSPEEVLAEIGDVMVAAAARSSR